MLMCTPLPINNTNHCIITDKDIQAAQIIARERNGPRHSLSSR